MNRNDRKDELHGGVESDFQSLLIRAGELYAHEIPMTKEQELIASVSVDDYIGVSICSLADYRKFDTDDFMEYDGYEDVRECEPSFVAPSDGTYLPAFDKRRRRRC
jgi:hypothetical protein